MNLAGALTADHPCKLARAVGPRNFMKIFQIQAIIHTARSGEVEKDNGDTEAACKFDRERA
jgi:hypothetical protein